MITGSNYTPMPAHSHTNKLAHSTVLQENKHIPHPPARLSPLAFLFRKEDKYPHNRKSLPLMHFQQSTASIHVFTYKSEFILCPLQSDLF